MCVGSPFDILKKSYITRNMVIKSNSISVIPITVEEAAQGFAACGAESRLTVLRLLVRAGDEGLTVGQIRERTGFPASTLAHHLRFLAAGGLVEQERRGRSVISRASYRQIESLAAYLLEECCADAHPSPRAHAARTALRSKMT